MPRPQVRRIKLKVFSFRDGETIGGMKEGHRKGEGRPSRERAWMPQRSRFSRNLEARPIAGSNSARLPESGITARITLPRNEFSATEGGNGVHAD